MPKVTPEDLVNSVISADDLRRKARGQPSTRAAEMIQRRRHPGESRGPEQDRLWIEPLFNLLGSLWGACMYFMPWRIRKPYVQWVVRSMGGHLPEVNPELPERIQQTVSLARDLKARTGKWPALLVLTSHPDTEGPLHWLRFELLLQGLQIADAVVEAQHPGAWYASHPKCLLAIDPFALDTVSVPVGAFYGAWMHRIYLAWDRQPSTQSWLQKHLLLRHTGYDRIVWRLLRTLRGDIPVAMVLSGGLPYNARLLYASREFVQRLPVKLWKVPKRQAQKELMEILMTPEGNVWPADQGDIPPGKRRLIEDAMRRWGLPGEMADSCLLELVAEFKLPVPHRARLFRILEGRLVKKGKPLLVVRLDHGDSPPYVRVSTPVSNCLSNPL